VHRTIDKKTATIFVLLVLIVITGTGWLSSMLRPPHDNALPIPYDNTYSWTQIFHGYEAYLDRRISYFDNIQGTSMEPTFGGNDVILLVEVNPAELKVGDIIVFQHPTLANPPLIAHRIIEVGTDIDGKYKFRTKGDNMSEPDQHWVPEEKVEGLVIGVIYYRTS